MADAPVEMKQTLGLTGLTMNAMALIAPGAFLWLTYAGQAAAGTTAPSMWIGHPVCHSVVSGHRRLLRGNGKTISRHRQLVLLCRTILPQPRKAWPYARLAKFIVGWGSHLYYWIYPGVMVGVIGVISGYLVGTLWPNFMSASNPGPMFMMAVAIVFAFAVSYIAHRGVNGSTSVNIAINVIQISALLVFTVIALGYRINHPPGSIAFQFDPANQRRLQLRVRHHQDDGEWSKHRYHCPRRRRNAAMRLGRRRETSAFHITIPSRFHRYFPFPSQRRLSHRHA